MTPLKTCAGMVRLLIANATGLAAGRVASVDNDPGQTQDVSADHAGAVARYIDEIEQWRQRYERP
ncbi:MAG: hypothetical protein AAFY69_11085 [Pseudomonadota bacterium]